MSQQGVVVIPVLVHQDNYVWLFPTLPGKMAAVDPGEAEAVIAFLDGYGVSLSHILITHHHNDHIDGVELLRQRYQAKVIGAAADAHRLPPLDHAVVDGDKLRLGDQDVTVLETPGHTLGHVVYHTEDALFSGDTLFSCGCGRLFEGSADQMWASLQRLMALPGNWRLFAGHEYTLINLKFALHLEPDHQGLKQFYQHANTLVHQRQPTLPVRLEQEKQINPFLRCHTTNMAQYLDRAGQSGAAVFAALRQLRNNWR
ncbi:MAG: hydroxyacylglutathione hydrolase [Magnetococcales bacterium]|nr:hydroxyacylglutathione hydrolase [Magnetococcales bacterium]